ncbi:RagB/SusD family nutrient uptake outer membrane protein [Oceanihabitans sp. 2_MG-2023]|uniref:RagB/SusD family nutrient uptake outer membrane protein n=1 Tax=Oceanihabitans sp. 2_MG-2023 TaxID=3062661 RepID=UPI0026E312ED|nr:RagB/SusD family nutrient uptake outer membrane protein [Oceanihabitans sp. 2_MG-2023]MDO6596543.1 RagB/SusD family nutrient uptake outer membrane protein [Oceanihabitans sp. 2_MG-2023]
MKILKNSVLPFMLIFLALGCSDYLDVEPTDTHEIEDSVYFQQEADYQAAVIGTYDPLQWMYLNTLIGDIASDNSLCGGESATDVIGLQQIDDMTHNPNNDNLTNLWKWCYEGVNRANYLEENKTKLDFDGKEALYGEVYFLRAYYYFELVKFFGDVPVFVDRRLDASDSGNIPRSPKADVYTQIETDLRDAIAVLPTTQSQSGRVTKYAAQALLGKAYLYQEKFPEAATTLNNVIGAFTLVDDFESQFLKSGENGIESVFEVQYTNTSEWYDWDYVPQGTEGNFGIIHNGPRADIAGYARGWAFNVPTQDLYDAYDSEDTRREATILTYSGDASSLAGYEQTGYFNHKYIPRAGESGAQTELNYLNNYRAIRYADVLLMAAEANARGNISDGLAQQYLNEVRRRAFGDLDHDITSSGNTLVQAIWNERKLELAMEGHRFFDLVRTGEAASTINGFTTNKHEVFPIPQLERDISGITQNEGY